MNTTAAAGQLYGYDVMDANGSKIGTVDNAWVDDATDNLEFVGVKTGWLFGKSHVIPVENAQIDDNSRSIQLPYSQDQVKSSPNFDGNSEISPDEEQQIYDYYGMQRSTSASPSGYAAGSSGPSEGMTTDTATDNTIPSQPADADMAVSKEELQVGKRTVQAGEVRLRKVVNTEHQEVPVELRREEIEIERVPVTDGQTVDNAFQEQEITVPVMEEQAVVAKEAHTTGQVHVGKNVTTEQRTVGGDVRSEDIEIDGEDGVELVGEGDGDTLPH